MALVEQLKTDLTEAMKAGETLKIETLRGILSSIHNAEIEKKAKNKGSKLSGEDVLAVLRKEAKKRKESVEVYDQAGRRDLADKEKSELGMIKTYLPPPLDISEIENIVKRIVKETDGDNFGAVMKGVMAEVAGRAEAKMVSEIVKRELGQG